MPNEDHRLVPLSTLDVKVGDILKLKSGGPKMTVEHVNIHYIGEPPHGTKATREECLMRGLRAEAPPQIDESRTTVNLVWFSDTHKGWVLCRDEIKLSLLESEV